MFLRIHVSYAFLTSSIFKLWWVSLVAQTVRNLPAMSKTQVQSLDGKDPLEKGMATYSSILAWRIPWTEEPGGLQPIGLQRAGHDWTTNTFTLSPSGHKPDQGRSVLRSYMPTYTIYMPMSFSWTTILMTFRNSLLFYWSTRGKVFLRQDESY